MNKILVTGDTGGLGSEIVRILLEKTEFGILGVDYRNTSEAEKRVEAYPERYLHFDFDLEQVDKISEFYLKTLKEHGPIAGLVNNAAFAYDDIVTNAAVDPLEKMFRINFHAPVMLTKYVIRDMLLHDISGSLVHISSVAAHTGYKGLSMYAATKGALESFSRTVAREWGAKGIRSNCVAPGFMETQISSTLTKDQKDRIYKRTSMKKATNPVSVAETIVYLLTDAASSVSGSVYFVDNGTL